MYVFWIFSFFRRRSCNFNPLHKPYYNSYNSLINTERKITTLIWVIYLIRLANESAITWTIIRLRQRAKWQPEFSQATARAGVASSAARHPQLSCLRVELSSQLKIQVTSHLIPATVDTRLSKTKVLSTFSSQQFGGGGGIRIERVSVIEREECWERAGVNCFVDISLWLILLLINWNQ